jgi:hypothetical protein
MSRKNIISSGDSRWADAGKQTEVAIAAPAAGPAAEPVVEQAPAAATKKKKKTKRLSVVDVGASMAFDGDDDFLNGF